jgi:ankyrin repeat protein
MAICDAAENGHTSIVRLLLGRQVSALNKCAGYDDRPLLNAAANGHAETVKVLLKHSANIPPNAVSELGFGPPTSFDFSRVLNEAFRQGQQEIVDILLEDPRVSLNNQSLPAAAWGGNESLVDLCLREAPPWQPQSGYESPLGAAARRGNEAAFMMILNSDGTDPNMRDDSLRTPLAVAAEFGQKNILKILLQTPSVEFDPNDKSGNTPLRLAARRGDIELVEELLETGAVDIDSKRYYNSTPLCSAAAQGHEEIVSLLIAAGANPDHRDRDGETPLASAAIFGAAKVVKVLLATGRVNPASKDRYKRTPLIEAARSGRFLGRSDDFVRTRAYEQETEKIIILLLRGEKIETPVVKDQPLEQDATRDTSTRQALSVMEQLLALKEVDPNAQDSDGRTALSHAAEMHEVEAVRILMENKRVDVNLADKDGWTPMTWVTKKVKTCPWNYDWEAHHGI